MLGYLSASTVRVQLPKLDRSKTWALKRATIWSFSPGLDQSCLVLTVLVYRSL
jgi:hypothetical protein